MRSATKPSKTGLESRPEACSREPWAPFFSAAKHPVPRHGRAALECLEVDDDVGLDHHLDRFFTTAKAAWAARAALKRIQGIQRKGEAP